MIEGLLIDNSAWARLSDQRVPRKRIAEVAEAVEAGGLHVCAPFVLEAGYSAHTAADRDSMLSELLSLPWASIDDTAERGALVAQQQLAHAGHRSTPPVDVIIAAIAHARGLGVLHYDADFDLIASLTSLTFKSEWLVAAGSL